MEDRSPPPAGKPTPRKILNRRRRRSRLPSSPLCFVYALQSCFTGGGDELLTAHKTAWVSFHGHAHSTFITSRVSE